MPWLLLFLLAGWVCYWIQQVNHALPLHAHMKHDGNDWWGDGSDELPMRYVAAEQKCWYCLSSLSNVTQPMFYNVVYSLHTTAPLTVPSYFSATVPFPWWGIGCFHENVNCIKLRQPRAQADQHLLLLWVQSSFSYVFLGIWTLCAHLFRFSSLVHGVYTSSGFNNSALLSLVLSQSWEFLSSESQRLVMLSLRRNVQ